MGKQTKFRKPENVGRGKVTPTQIAFIVDRYLSDNNFTQTHSSFRTNASHVISKSPVQEAPKSLLSLGAMLDEYVRLKEQKVMLDQDKCHLEQEKFRVQSLLRGMQDVMNAYTVGGTAAPLSPRVSSVVAKSAMVPQIDLTRGSPAGCQLYTTPFMRSTSRTSNAPTNPSNFSTPITNHPTSKRKKSSKDVSDVPIVKRSRSCSSTNQLQAKGTETFPQPSNASNNQETGLQFFAVQASPLINLPNGSPVQGSSVAKCLFNQPSQSPPANSTGPTTPPQATTSPNEKSISPLETSTITSTNNVTPLQITSTNSTVITSETIRVTPVKQIAYYSIERNHCISSSSPIKTNLERFVKRDHVKGRLDFDGTEMAMNAEKPNPCGISASESEKEGELFDLDLPNLEALGVDFSLSELLLNFDFDGEGIDYSCQPAMGSSLDSLSESPLKSRNVIMDSNQVLSEISSTMEGILSEKDMNILGPDSPTSVKSLTKCIKIISPVKNHRRC